ncbi:NAD(P)H-quinone oxidoreductase [Zavarzinia sp. CC-PAN008]|uniref:NAD(P)H-quinone oxidoreductase n=1 Tax=Zavarzinia sp. CC-PAN008 TaxID=3243332 RepID=UPI003F7487B6
MPPLPPDMAAIAVRQPGGPEMIELVRLPVPQPDAGQVLIRVRAAGLNRGDMVQRQGHYPPPPGAPQTMGLEVAGEVAALGPGVTGWAIGDPVCALVAGGGYAEYCLAYAGHVLAVPPGLDMVAAAAAPETIMTVWTNVFDACALQPGETLLVHGGASGIGTMAIHMARALGSPVYVTAGSPGKCAACLEVGATAAIDHRAQDFVAELMRLTGGRGVDVILDMVGGDYIQRNMAAAAHRGRIVSIAFLEGVSTSVNFLPMMLKRLTLTGSTLRGRAVAEKTAITDTVRARIWPLVAAGTIRPIVDRTYPLAEAAAAHAYMEAGQHVGKIVLTT